MLPIGPMGKTHGACRPRPASLVFIAKEPTAMPSLAMIQTLYANYALGISGACIGDPR